MSARTTQSRRDAQQRGVRKIDHDGRSGFQCDELGVIDVGHAFESQCASPSVQQPNAQKGGGATSGAASGREQPGSRHGQGGPRCKFAFGDHNGCADPDADVFGPRKNRLGARRGRRSVIRLHGDGLFAKQVGGERGEGDQEPQQGSQPGRNPRSAGLGGRRLPHGAWSVGSGSGPSGEFILEDLLILVARAEDRSEMGRERVEIVEKILPLRRECQQHFMRGQKLAHIHTHPRIAQAPHEHGKIRNARGGHGASAPDVRLQLLAGILRITILHQRAQALLGAFTCVLQVLARIGATGEHVGEPLNELGR